MIDSLDFEDSWLLKMWSFMKLGISPREFRRLRISDINNILEIEDANRIKNKRNTEINKMLNEKW